MSDFSRVRLSKGSARRVELHWRGARAPLTYSHVSVWVDGRLIGATIERLRRVGRSWRVSGRAELPGGVWQVEDTLTPRGNTLVIDRRWRWRGGRLASVRLGLDVEVPFPRPDHWTMPYISMDGNAGSRTVPAGFAFEGQPWTFREERTTAPCLMTIEAAGLAAGTYTEPGRDERTTAACCILPGRGGHTLRTFFPFREGPCTFLGAGFPGNSKLPAQGLFVGGSGPSGFTVDGRAAFRRRFFAVLDRAEHKRHGYARVWESAWNNLREPIAPPIDLARTERLMWKSIDYHWVESGGACGYSVRIGADGEPLSSFSPSFESAWCGPTMMLAWLAIRRALRTGRLREADRPIRAADFYVSQPPTGNGTFRTGFDLRKMQWSDHGLNAVQMGGAAYWLIRCVELLAAPREQDAESGCHTLSRRSRCCTGIVGQGVPQRPGHTLPFGSRCGTRKSSGQGPLDQSAAAKLGIDAGRWARFALDFCDLAVQTQARSGAFGAHWSLDGKCLGAERAMGVHAARAVLEAHRLTGRADYLRAAERGARFYVRHMVEREAGYGDCTDLLATTTENDAAGVADFLIDLAEVTGKRGYLDAAVRSAEYCLSYLFTYNVHFARHTDCGRRGMRTRGCAAISPETAFVCPFFALQANAFCELWRITGQRRWRDYAVAIVRGSLQMLTERGDTFGLADGLVGCRAEVIPVLDAVKGQHVWKKGMTEYAMHQPVWWPAAFNLLNFAVIEDRCSAVARDLAR